jgi:hypothetical protein
MGVYHKFSGVFPILENTALGLHCEYKVLFVEWDQLHRFSLTRSSVIQNAPEESGVYGLAYPGKWVYIGHSFNIRKALLDYLSGQKPYVLQWQPRLFAFELLPYKERLVRHKELLVQYHPACNRKTQSLVR